MCVRVSKNLLYRWHTCVRTTPAPVTALLRYPARMPSTALCLLGSVRTLALECTGATTLRRLATPLGAAVFAFVNVPQEWKADRVEGVRLLVRALVRNAALELRALEVDNHSPNSARRGAHQARGLRRCWDVVGVSGAFEYIVRARTDVYHGFVLPERLPEGPSPSAAYVGFLGKPGCAPRRESAPWVDDRFSLLRGRLAQRVFLRDFAAALDAPRDGTTAPECVLGTSVADADDRANASAAHEGLILRDVRATVAVRGACRRANAQIVRSKNCSEEVGRAPWVCPPHDAHPPVVVIG